jgi:hypothetical protein
VDATIALIRFFFGALIGGVVVAFVAIWTGLVPVWLGIALPTVAGVFAVFFGDRFLAQRRLKVLALSPIPIVIAAAATLFFAVASHWSPTFGDPLGILHLALVAGGLAWGIRVLRSGRSNGGEPSNSTPHTDVKLPPN